jgi:hypothetical protein
MLITHFCLHYCKRGKGGGGGGFTKFNGGGSLHHKIKPHFLTIVMLRTAIKVLSMTIVRKCGLILARSKKNQQQQ